MKEDVLSLKGNRLGSAIKWNDIDNTIRRICFYEQVLMLPEKERRKFLDDLKRNKDSYDKNKFTPDSHSKRYNRRNSWIDGAISAAAKLVAYLSSEQFDAVRTEKKAKLPQKNI